MHHVIGADASGRVAVPVQHNEGFGAGNRQSAEQNRVHEAVDNRVRADAESQGEQRQDAKGWVAQH